MAVTTHRELDVSTVKTFLRSLKEGRFYIAKVTGGGRNGKYAYLVIPEELVERFRLAKGSRLDVRIGENYVDYIVSDTGDYAVLMGARKGAKIRFPLSYRGYVLIEPRPRGFRVYFA